MNDDDKSNVVPFPQKVTEDDCDYMPDWLQPGVDIEMLVEGHTKIPDFAEWANAQFFSELSGGKLGELLDEIRAESIKNPDITEFLIANLERLVKHIKNVN